LGYHLGKVGISGGGRAKVPRTWEVQGTDGGALVVYCPGHSVPDFHEAGTLDYTTTCSPFSALVTNLPSLLSAIPCPQRDTLTQGTRGLGVA